MKTMKFLSLMLLFMFAADGALAQSTKELDKLLKEMKGLSGEHVEYNDELENVIEFDFDSDDVEMELSILLSKLDLLSMAVVECTSKDEQGYEMLSAMIEKYELGENDDFASIPLLANEKEGNEITYFYSNDGNSLLVNIVQNEKITIVYMICDIAALLEQLLKELLELDDDDFGEGNVSYNFNIGKSSESSSNKEIKR